MSEVKWWIQSQQVPEPDVVGGHAPRSDPFRIREGLGSARVTGRLVGQLSLNFCPDNTRGERRQAQSVASRGLNRLCRTISKDRGSVAAATAC
jgi:hypothetical protein